jgi:mono/diheme cytochrome c family protein
LKAPLAIAFAIMAFYVVSGAALAATPSSGLIAQGRYLAVAADCTACHTAPGSNKPFSGGNPIVSPLGTIYATNITPSKVDGIGTYTEAEFARALRQGIRQDGVHLYPAMPYTAYAKLSDADVGALYAYFMQGVLPVESKPPTTALPFPFNIRLSMIGWNLLFLDEHQLANDPSRTVQWNRGAYLTEALEHCSACHTPRSFLMSEDAGVALAGGKLGAWYAPNISSDLISGIGGWSQTDLVQYLGTGNLRGRAQAAGPMAEAVQNSLQYLTQNDLQAIAVYLKATPPMQTAAVRSRYSYGSPASFEGVLRGADPSGMPGAQIYSGACASCHQATGAGTADGVFPQLFQNTATGAAEPNNVIAVILYGLNRKVNGNQIFMPAFSNGSYVDVLTDQEVADVANFVFKQFGNPNVTVTAQDVAVERQGGPPSLLASLGGFVLPVIALVVVVILGIVLALILRRRARQRNPRRAAAIAVR